MNWWSRPTASDWASARAGWNRLVSLSMRIGRQNGARARTLSIGPDPVYPARQCGVSAFGEGDQRDAEAYQHHLRRRSERGSTRGAGPGSGPPPRHIRSWRPPRPARTAAPPAPVPARSKPTTPPMTAVRLVSRFSDQRAPARHARMQQHREVADFLRDFVRHDGQRRHDAEVHVGEEGRGDQHAVEHVVQGIADQHQRAARLLAGLLVLMRAWSWSCASPTGCSSQ